jgi:hypothetical protein
MSIHAETYALGLDEPLSICVAGITVPEKVFCTLRKLQVPETTI